MLNSSEIELSIVLSELEIPIASNELVIFRYDISI
jgi:hypothetical protein